MEFTFFRHNQFQFNQKIFCTHLGIKIINQIRLVNEVYFKLGVPTFFNLISYEPGLSCLPRLFKIQKYILQKTVYLLEIFSHHFRKKKLSLYSDDIFIICLFFLLCGRVNH